MLVARPHETLEDIIPKLNIVTGLPVISADGQVVGVISRKAGCMPVPACMLNLHANLTFIACRTSSASAKGGSRAR